MEAKYNPYRGNPNRTKCEEHIYDQGYEAGIREVVGWIEDNIWFVAKTEPQSMWQAKLKVWGIEVEGMD